MLMTMLSIAVLAAGQAADPLKAACDQAAAHLAAAKPKEALAVLEPLARDAAAGGSPERFRFFYYLGCAAFAAENDLVAGRALARLAPFEQPLYAAHARYLLGRLHHRAGEFTEAGANYDAVAPAFEKMPADKKTPVPDFVADAVYHSGTLLFELKQFEAALARFLQIVQKEKRAGLVEEARLRAGLCQVRLRQNAEAVKTLQPLLAHARLARTARWGTAQAILKTDGSKPADVLEHLAKAVEAPESPSAPATAEIQLALGDALGRAGKPAEAAAIYQTLAAGPHAEEALARLAAAQAAAGKVPEAEATAGLFAKQFPSSPFGAGVQLSLADAAAAAGGKNPAALADAVKRYEQITGDAAVGLIARFRMASALFRLNRLPEALQQVRAIPDSDRVGELAGAALIHAECLLRTLPPAEDAVEALQAAALLKDLQEAVSQLQKAASAAPSPEMTLKVAGALRQTAALLAEPAERTAAANQARELYEAFRAQHANHALRPVAEYERANCFALAGDPNQAIQKLERFKADPLGNSPVAPLALLRQAQLYRAANNPGQAAAVLTDCRTKHEAALLKDAARAGWVPLLRWHHAAALKAANQAAQAVPILESLVKDFGGSEWAEPARRLLKEAKP